MKWRKALYFILTVLPLAVTLVILPSLPERIPAHYDIHGSIDRMGSRYEALILPAVIIVNGIFLWIMQRITARKSERNAVAVEWIGIFTLFIFNLLNAFMLNNDMRMVTDMKLSGFHFEQIVAVIIGLLFIGMGCLLPRMKRNPWIGLRTPWSMKNDTTWKKSQAFAAKSSVIAGIVILVSGLLLKGGRATAIMIVALAVSLATDIIYSYFIAKKY